MANSWQLPAELVTPARALRLLEAEGADLAAISLLRAVFDRGSMEATPRGQEARSSRFVGRHEPAPLVCGPVIDYEGR